MTGLVLRGEVYAIVGRHLTYITNWGRVPWKRFIKRHWGLS